MEQKTFFTILKKTIREEVRNVIKQELSDILKEGLQSTVNEIKTEQVKKKPVVKKKNNIKFETNKFSNILNETTQLVEDRPVSNYANMMNESFDEMKFTSNDAQGFGMMRQNNVTAAPTVMHDPETGKDMQVDPVVAKALTRDYSSLLKTIDKKKGNK